jgi:Domain of unknown function (DUF4282)
MDARSALYFDSMLTPKIITIVYWIMLVVVLLGGLATMFGVGSGGFSLVSVIMGAVGIVIGGLFTRIWCELLIVLFKINENVQKIAASK